MFTSCLHKQFFVVIFVASEPAHFVKIGEKKNRFHANEPARRLTFSLKPVFE